VLEGASPAAAKAAAGEASASAAPPKPEPDELDRGAETNTWFISEAIPCIELAKKMGLKAE